MPRTNAPSSVFPPGIADKPSVDGMVASIYKVIAKDFIYERFFSLALHVD
jgi:hypothetical protein